MKVIPMLFVLILGLSFSCKNTAEPEVKKEVRKEVSAITKTPQLKKPAKASDRMRYTGATVYAGSTDFEFVGDDGNKVLIRVNNIDDTDNRIFPDDMLQIGENVEGPPVANPQLIGKYFDIEQDKHGFYRKITLSKK